jgi:hypothetical protein
MPKNKKTRKGPGADKITVNDVKQTQENFHECLANILNKCIKFGIFPDPLKENITRPAHKDPSNYRPIAMLSVVDKIFETYIDIQLTNYIQEFVILDSRQFAYQKNKGTETLLADLSNYILMKILAVKSITYLPSSITLRSKTRHKKIAHTRQ